MGFKERLKRMFGEPAAVVGVLQVALAAVVAWHQIGLSNAQAGVILAAAAALAALYQAYITKTVALAAVAQAFNAIVALFAGFGLALSADQVSSLYGVVAFGVAAWLRTQTGVAITPGFHDEPVVHPIVFAPEPATTELPAVPEGGAVIDNGTPLDD